MGMETSEKLVPPVQQVEDIVDAEPQPVQPLRIPAEIRRRPHVLERSVAVAVPDASHFFRRLVPAGQPLAKLAFGGIAVAVNSCRAPAVVSIFVPQVAAPPRRMISIAIPPG